MTGPMTPWPALPISAHAGVNDHRVLPRHSFVVQAQPLHHTRPKTFDNHVGVLGHLQKDFGLPFQVDFNAFLSPIDRMKVRTHAVRKWKWKTPQVVAFRRLLNLDDPGSHLAEQARRVTAR